MITKTIDHHRWLGGCGLLGALFLAAAAAADPTAAPVKPAVPHTRQGSLAPLPAGEKPVSSHAPFETGCDLCHKNDDPKNPGPLLTNDGNKMCFECHEDMPKILGRKFSHAAAKERCINCHNPHNSKQRKLLVEEVSDLCMSCHSDVKSLATDSVVKHDALTTEKKCSNCHNPHGANVEHLLIKTPGELCLTCHGKDDVVDHQGKKLTNIKKLLDENHEWHAPVAAGDCTACHNPHGGKNFRLLNKEYPPTFYSSFDPKLYALCFECHEERMLAEPQTTTLTQFRNGNKNLHFVHVNKIERGRTCRACHEVHAAKQPHEIRDSVPYGPKGWPLMLNYTRTPTGGSCTKTCHQTRSYDNTVTTAPAPQ